MKYKKLVALGSTYDGVVLLDETPTPLLYFPQRHAQDVCHSRHSNLQPNSIQGARGTRRLIRTTRTSAETFATSRKAAGGVLL